MTALLAVATVAAGLALAVFLAQDKLIFFPQPLSPAQREAVRQFLLLRRSDQRHEFSHPMIDAALENYWTVTPEA